MNRAQDQRTPVASDPRTVTVSLCNPLPEPHYAILVALEVPKCRICRAVVGVPVRVLAAGDRMHIEGGVDTVPGADINYAVDVFKPDLDEPTGVHIIVEMLVTEV